MREHLLGFGHPGLRVIPRTSNDGQRKDGFRGVLVPEKEGDVKKRVGGGGVRDGDQDPPGGLPRVVGAPLFLERDRPPVALHEPGAHKDGDHDHHDHGIDDGFTKESDLKPDEGHREGRGSLRRRKSEHGEPLVLRIPEGHLRCPSPSELAQMNESDQEPRKDPDLGALEEDPWVDQHADRKEEEGDE